MTAQDSNTRARDVRGCIVFVVLLAVGSVMTHSALGHDMAAQEARNTAYTELAIRGLTNDQDAARVQKALAAVTGVFEAKVSREEERAYIILDGDAIPSQESLIRAVKVAGFDAGSAVGRDYQEYEAFDAHDTTTCADPEHRHAETTPASEKAPLSELFTLSKDARELKARFNEDADKLRLVVLLSPT